MDGTDPTGSTSGPSHLREPERWTPDAMERERVVRYEDLVPCVAAFIDANTPGSHLKENFTIVGPGVSENPRQHIHIGEQHGFNIGGARQPAHITNSQHSHETAEVFIVVTGTWAFRTGIDSHAPDAEVILNPGDTISLPTRVFRGFENVTQGEEGEPGFLFAILGGDDPGRVTWAPQVIQAAQGHGLVLLDDGRLVDTTAGEVLPPDRHAVRPLTEDEVALFQHVTTEELERFVVRADRVRHAEAVIAPEGGTISSAHWPHGFIARALRGNLPATAEDVARVILVVKGAVEARWEDGTLALGRGDTFTIPRSLEVGLELLSQDAQAFLIEGDPEHAVPNPLPGSMYLVPVSVTAADN